MSKAQPSITIMASGRGSNFAAIVNAVESGRMDAKITALVCNKEDAPVLKLAEEKNIRTLLIPDKNLSREDHENQILSAMEKAGFSDFLVLAGYMKKITPALLRPFRSERGYYRVVNIHPSLLPAFPGIHSYQRAFQYGCAVTGVTVHLVDEKLDQGPICDQRAFGISHLRSSDEVEQEGLSIENHLYPEVLSWVLKEEFELESRQMDESVRRVCVRKS